MVEATQCPQCGFSGSSTLECPRCGIIYAKIRKLDGSTTPVSARDCSEDRRGSASKPRRLTLLPWLLGLAVIIAIVTGFDAFRKEEPTPNEPQLTTGQPATSEAISPLGTPPELAAPTPNSRPAPEPEWNPSAAEDLVLLPDPAPIPKPAATASYFWHVGASGYQRGIEEAQREGRPMAVYFYTDWCPYCRELESELLSRAKVEEFLKYLVKIKINPDRGTRERSLANQYGVRGYPSFFVQSAPSARPQKIRRSNRNGLKSPEEFVDTLEQAAR